MKTLPSVWVPGAYELPLAAGALAKTGKYSTWLIALVRLFVVALPTLNMSLVVQDRPGACCPVRQRNSGCFWGSDH